jgi:signal transduction histidine kinase
MPFSESDREALRIVRRVLFALDSLERERTAVAAQKQAEREEARLRMLVMEAGRRSSLGELASVLAHELNQPLAAVTNYVNACRQELRNYGRSVPDDINDLIESAVGEASRAAALVRRLRNFISGGEVVAERIDLRAPIRQGVDLALASADGPPPEVSVDVWPDVPRIDADPIQIGLVVLNLVRNSLPAMRDSPVRSLAIVVRRVGEEVEIAVSDTGCGVPPDLLDTVFEPFHRSTTRGMGIGLSLCRSIVEAHGGRIWFEPRSSGAKVVFTLPVDGPRP